jgi:hypothetical protein
VRQSRQREQLEHLAGEKPKTWKPPVSRHCLLNAASSLDKPPHIAVIPEFVGLGSEGEAVAIFGWFFEQSIVAEPATAPVGPVQKEPNVSGTLNALHRVGQVKNAVVWQDARLDVFRNLHRRVVIQFAANKRLATVHVFDPGNPAAVRRSFAVSPFNEAP